MVDLLRDWVSSVVRQELAVARSEGEARAHVAYMTTREAAQYSRVTPGTIRRWIVDGRLQRHGTGKYILVSRAELDGLVRADGKRQPVLPSRKKRAPSETPEQRAERMLGLAS